MNISFKWLKQYRVIIIILSLILIWIITIWAYSSLDIQDELCESLSLCPYKGSDPERKHHLVAYYKNPLFFGKNIVIVWSDQFISYNTSSPTEYVWGKTFGDTISQDIIDKISESPAMMIESPVDQNKKIVWWVDICLYWSRFCKEERLYQAPDRKNNIADNDACMIILTQNEGSEIVDILKEYDKNCYVVDLRYKSWDKIVLSLKNS